MAANRSFASDPTKVTRADARALLGGKPRKTFDRYTEQEKREIRAGHRDRLDAALSRLEDPLGMSRFLVSRHIHGDTQTPANTALAADQAPGELVGTYGQFARVGLKPRKGQEHDLVLTGKTFWPVAAWKGSSHGMRMPGLPVPDAEHCAKLAALWLSWPDHSTEGLKAWIEATNPAILEGEPVEAPKSDPIPF